MLDLVYHESGTRPNDRVVIGSARLIPGDYPLDTPLQRVLAALSVHGCNPRRVGSGWTACCPSHHDRRPSLSIAEAGDGTVLVKCHASCPTPAVLRKLGLELRDLFPSPLAGAPISKAGSKPKPIPVVQARSEPNGNGQVFGSAEQAIAVLESRLGPVASKWNYYDAAGELTGIICRWNVAEGKTIRPVAKFPDGWHIAAMPAPRPLYNLRALLAAPPDQPVVVTEGEKAADAAMRCDLLAVTSAGGASAAHLTDWGPLRARRVVILPDADTPGLAYAECVAELCWKAGAAEIRVVRLANYTPALPESGDLFDVLADDEWLLIGLGDAAEPADFADWLVSAAESVEPWRPTPAVAQRDAVGWKHATIPVRKEM